MIRFSLAHNISSSERVRERDRDVERGAGVSGEKHNAYERKVAVNLPYGVWPALLQTKTARVLPLLCLR